MTPSWQLRNRNLYILKYIVMSALLVFVAAPTFSENEEKLNEEEILFEEASNAYKNGNFNLAFEKFSILSNLGVHDAQYNLAVILKSGKGVPKDYSEALFWSWRALLGGIELANDQSEELIEFIPEKSLKDIRNRIRDSLNTRIFEGDSEAIIRLANYYVLILEEPDYENAYLWFLVSAALSQQGGLVQRDEVEKQLSREKVVKIQKEAYDLFLSLPEVIRTSVQMLEK